jgi:hypothetical protein
MYTGTANQPPRRRVVRRRSTLERAYGTVLGDLPEELRPLVLAYVDNMREGQRVRSELTTALSRTGLRWRDVDTAARELAYPSTV